ncbi:MAG: hypothetical protein KDK30_09185, partial [Leptospiraceae bacterium]|nr:hypothetical protein [Leptospiraceae bacterium]
RFGFCQSVGVCAHHQVDSIVYLQRRVNDQGVESKSMPTGRLFVDSGSRSSVALLQILFQRSYPDIPIKLIVCPPERIPRQLQPGDGGLLIGDSALEFTRSTSARDYQITDLATWWHKLEGLPFVFALWAYPLNTPIADEFFEQSLAVGQSNMDHIVADAGALLSLTEARRYLTATLHYKLTEEDRRSLVRFEELLTRYHLSGDADSQSGARSTQY